jgi:hypothetical protein
LLTSTHGPAGRWCNPRTVNGVAHSPNSALAAPRPSAQAAAGLGMNSVSARVGGTSSQNSSQAHSPNSVRPTLPASCRNRGRTAPNARRSIWRRAVSGAASAPPASYNARHADRRTLPLEVFSTV